MAITEGRGEVSLERVRDLARTGVEYLLVREKALEAGKLATLSRSILGAVRGTGMRVLIAERVDIAAAVRAHGVHLSARSGELTPQQVRTVLPDAFVSVSCHTLDEVRRARENRASAVLFGPVYGKVVDGVQVTPGVGVETLHAACLEAHELPVFALGGVTLAELNECEAAGARGVAAIRMFFEPYLLTQDFPQAT